MVNVALLGFGTVGSGVAEVLTRNGGLIDSRVDDLVRLKYIMRAREVFDGPYQDLFVKDFSIIEQDPQVRPWLRVAMIENYNVTWAEALIPACDISEQISLASKEASGTGNMKFMANGAVTLGTMDGANVEIAGLVGKGNIYTFGASSDQVIALYRDKAYDPRACYHRPQVERLVDFLVSPELLAIGDPASLSTLWHDMKSKDWFMALLDVEDYIQAKARAIGDYGDRLAWGKKMLVNIAKSGYFSSDRTIRQYNEDIWHLT